MFTIEDLLSNENQSRALASFRQKRNGSGPDGMRISELENYWKANHSLIEDKIRRGSYEPGMVKLFEVPTRSGKQRQIASINAVDRFVEKLIQIQLQQSLEPMFLPNSFAYQTGKGTLEAALLARMYIQNGDTHLCELDIRDFFQSIELGRLRKLCKQHLDKQVVSLISTFLEREVEHDGEVERISRGILQGSPMSPVLSNLYLHELDQKMESMTLNWLRFSDNINVYCQDTKSAEQTYALLRDEIGKVHQLGLNKNKSGVYRALDRRVLGYDLYRQGDTV